MKSLFAQINTDVEGKEGQIKFRFRIRLDLFGRVWWGLAYGGLVSAVIRAEMQTSMNMEA